MNKRSFDEDKGEIYSRDGRASLLLLRADPSRDFGGGYVYRLILSKPDHIKEPLSVEILIVNSTYAYAEEHYRETMQDFGKLKLGERQKYYNEYEINFGAVFVVKYFANANFDMESIDDRQYSKIAFIISEIYFLRYSVRCETDDSGMKYYNDKMIFSPHNSEIKCTVTYTSAEVLNHG